MDLAEQKKINALQFKRHPWELTRLKIVAFQIKKASKNLIVDVGSGDAYIAAQLSKTFPNSKLTAVDINYTDEFIKSNENGRLTFLRSIDDLPSSEPIDVLLLMDVLEHIEKPQDLLSHIRNLKNISSSTRLIVTVPAFQFLFSDHDVFLKHFKRYHRKQLKHLLQQQGFEIKHSGYFFTTLFVARLFQKLFGTQPKRGVYNWKGNWFLTDAFARVLWVDFKICWYLSRIGINLPGLSCYCVCHPLPS